MQWNVNYLDDLARELLFHRILWCGNIFLRPSSFLKAVYVVISIEKNVIHATDSSYGLQKVDEYSTRGGILLWWDDFHPKEAKWAYS